jgi:outer membrane protein assembly factor BamA
LASLCAAGCTAARREVHTDVVSSVSFEGNGGLFSFEQGDFLLASQMEQGDSPWGVTIFPMKYWTDPEAYAPDALERDAYRLEVWYAHHGWFDARVEGWEVVRTRPRGKKRAGVVRIRGFVSPGEPSMVRRFEVAGMDRPVHQQFRRTVLRTGWVQEGQRFDLDLVDETRLLLLDLLSRHGFPYARVDATMVAHPDDHAVEVTFDTDPGILATIGEVRVAGNVAVSEDVLLDTLTFEEGDRYDVRDLNRSQRRIFQLGTFSVVNVTPDLSDPTLREVPVTVSVTESFFRTLRLGAGASYTGGTLSPHVSATFRHTNMLHRLLQLEATGDVGYGISSRLKSTPIYGAGLTLSTPRLFTSDFGLVLSGSVEQDVQSGQYFYLNPKALLGLTFKPNEKLIFRTGPSWELYEFRDVDEDDPSIVVLFGEDFQNPYRLVKWSNQLVVDWRDDPVFTTRGSYYSIGLNQALPITEWIGGDNLDGPPGFLYTELSVDVRTYRRLRFKKRVKSTPFTAALRVQAKALKTWGDHSSLPYQEKAFLGGASSLRGCLADQVGPYNTVCIAPDPDKEEIVRYLPRGGNLGALGAVEVRYDINGTLSAVVFADVGLLVDSTEDVDFQSLRAGAGTGVRYASPVGPFRFDIGVRPLYPEDRGPDQVVGCEQSSGGPFPVERPYDPRVRSYDVFSALFPKKQRPRDTRTIPFALNVYIAIGEAF